MRGFFPNNVLEALPANWASPTLFKHLPGLRERALERSVNERITPDIIRRVLPDAVVHVEEPLRFAWFEDRQLKNGDISAPDPFSMSMLYKIWQADLMRKNAESAQGYPFDVVIRARPDFPFKPPDVEFLANLAEGDIYLDRFSHTDRNVGDGFALGNSATMDIYGKFFLTAYSKASVGQWRYVHWDFYEYLVEAGLSMKPYSMLGYSPDRMVDIQDVLESIASNPGAHPPPDEGYRLGSHHEVEIISEGVVIANLLHRDKLTLRDSRVVDHVHSRFSNHVAERDGGFLHVIANGLTKNGQSRLAIIYAAISLFEMVDSLLRPDVRDVYIGDFVETLREFTKSQGTVIDDPQLLFETCISTADPTHPLSGEMAYFFSIPNHRLQAVNALSMIILALKTEPGHWNWFIDYLEQRGDREGAERVTRAGLAELPDSPLFNARLALLLAQRGENDAAALAASIGASSSDPWSVFLSGKALMLAGRLADAESALRHAIALFPADADFYMELSVVLMRSGRSSEAIHMAREAAARSPEPMAHRHNHLGNVLLAGGFFAEAETAFREALRRAPSWDEVRMQVSQSLARQGRLAEAAEILNDVLSRRPTDSAVRAQLLKYARRAEQ